MKGLISSPGLYLEIGPTSLKVLGETGGLELPLERSPGGRLTDACKRKLAADLQNFLNRKSWQPRARAFCAIGANGVSFRRITVPSSGKEEFQRLLLMQIESAFPVSPDALAWGYRPLPEISQNGSTKQDLLVIAVKKEVIEEYSAALAGSGISPVFTVAALARSSLCPTSTGAYAILDVGNQSSELILFDSGVPASVRTLPLGSENGSTEEALDALARSLQNGWGGKKIFVSGYSNDFISSLLARRLGTAVVCEPLRISPGEGRSAAVLGLKKSVEEDGGRLLLFQSKESNGKAGFVRPAPLKWAALAAALAAGMFLLPYAEAIVFKPWMAKRVSGIRAKTGQLGIIDQELAFLQNLKQNQPPYLEALYLFAKSAPQGTRFDSLSMNRRGEVSLRTSMRNSDQVAEFRSKLIASGFFSSVAVEEQTPTPDRQKVNVRVTAQWKPMGELQGLNVGPTAEEIEKAKSKKDTSSGPPGFPPGMMPPGAMPAGLPPGVMPPSAMPPGVEMPPAPAPRVVSPEKK
jgi:hypothetical protein